MTTGTTKKVTSLASQLTWLRQQANPKNVRGMARFGINPRNALGISVVELRRRAKMIGSDHQLAGKLWRTRIHEARLLACFIEEPRLVTARQMDSWARSFDSWDICDQACANVFDQTPYAWKKARAWATDSKEFVRRAGFVMMAALAVHDKSAPDEKFLPFLRLIIKYSTDDRNFVRKAVNWALRQIGKRNRRLGTLARHAAELLASSPNRTARWIGADALREFERKSIR